MERLDFLLRLAALPPGLHPDARTLSTLATSSDRRVRPLFPLFFEELTLRGYPHIPDEFRKAAFVSEERSRTLKTISEKLGNLVERTSVNHINIKGLDIEDRYYEKQGLRPSGDIDILIAERDKPGLSEALSRAGFTLVSERPHYHARYEGQGAVLEVHTDIVSYKYRILFRLDAIQPDSLLREKRLSDEQYLLYSCLQMFDETGRRLLPLMDIFQILKRGIRLSAWEMLAASTETAFPVLYTHFYALERYGIDLFPAPLLAGFRVRDEHAQALRIKARSSDDKRAFYPLILKMAERRTEKALRLLFPPARVLRSYAPENGAGHLQHWKRIFKEIAGTRSGPGS